MTKKPSKPMNPVLKWTIIAVGFFVVGFIIAQLFGSGSAHQQPVSTYNLMGGGSQATEKILDSKEQGGGVLVIVIAVLIIATIIGVGYYFDKRKK